MTLLKNYSLPISGNWGPNLNLKPHDRHSALFSVSSSQRSTLALKQSGHFQLANGSFILHNCLQIRGAISFLPFIEKINIDIILKNLPSGENVKVEIYPLQVAIPQRR